MLSLRQHSHNISLDFVLGILWQLDPCVLKRRRVLLLRTGRVLHQDDLPLAALQLVADHQLVTIVAERAFRLGNHERFVRLKFEADHIRMWKPFAHKDTEDFGYLLELDRERTVRRLDLVF